MTTTLPILNCTHYLLCHQTIIIFNTVAALTTSNKIVSIYTTFSVHIIILPLFC